MATVGVPWDRSIVANFETGRRSTVNVEELLALAYVLDVAPVHLLVPPESGPYNPVSIVESNTANVRAWIRGTRELAGQDPRRFFAEVPLDEYEPPLRSAEGSGMSPAAAQTSWDRSSGERVIIREMPLKDEARISAELESDDG